MGQRHLHRPKFIHHVQPEGKCSQSPVSPTAGTATPAPVPHSPSPAGPALTSPKAQCPEPVCPSDQAASPNFSDGLEQNTRPQRRRNRVIQNRSQGLAVQRALLLPAGDRGGQVAGSEGPDCHDRALSGQEPCRTHGLVTPGPKEGSGLGAPELGSEGAESESVRHISGSVESETGQKSPQRGRQVPAGDINLGVGIWMTFEAVRRPMRECSDTQWGEKDRPRGRGEASGGTLGTTGRERLWAAPRCWVLPWVEDEQGWGWTSLAAMWRGPSPGRGAAVSPGAERQGRRAPDEFCWRRGAAHMQRLQDACTTRALGTQNHVAPPWPPSGAGDATRQHARNLS